MKQIKPCPFCGSENLSVGGFENYIKCKNCGAAGPDGSTLNEAFDKWNAAPRKEDVEMEKNCGRSTPLNAESPSGLKTLCEKAISKWGEAAQINKAIEELLELAIALTRYQNLNLRDEDYQEKAYKILDNIHEEREDVEIMLRQLDVIFGRSEEWQRKKYAHLQLIGGDTEMNDKNKKAGRCPFV